MTETEQERKIPMRVYRMNALLTGIVGGVLCGAGLFVVTLWLVIKGGDVVGPNLSLLANYFPGYRVTALGSVLGLVYGFLTGFVVTYAGSRLYNLFADLRRGRES